MKTAEELFELYAYCDEGNTPMVDKEDFLKLMESYSAQTTAQLELDNKTYKSVLDKTIRENLENIAKVEALQKENKELKEQVRELEKFDER